LTELAAQKVSWQGEAIHGTLLCSPLLSDTDEIVVLKQTRRRLLIAATAHVVGTVAIAVLYPVFGSAVGIFGMSAVLVGAFTFGRRGGVVAAVVQTLLNSLVMNVFVYPPEHLTGPAVLGIGFMFLAGYIVGNQRDLSRKWRDELVRNERLRVRETETLAAIPDAMIRLTADGACALQGADMPGGLGQALERALGGSLPAGRRAALAETIARVRTTGVAQALTLDPSTTTSYDVRCLPAADASVLVVLRDVTEQRRLLRRVTSSENLASLGTLAAGLAHEINNPLTYVISSVYAAKLVLGEAGEPVKSDLDAALNGCWRIRDLVKNILDTTMSKRDIIEPVLVAEVVEAALALVKPQVRHRATIDWNPAVEIYALAHRTKLLQVVVNLVMNASQSFEDNRASTNTIQVRARANGEEVLIEVEDNGSGMDEATRLRAVEPFFTTKEPGQGSGLGLFLCNSIIESLAGRLQIDSETGKGTKVTVRLPVAPNVPATKRTRTISAPMTADSTPRLRVLVVDDEPDIRHGLYRILSRKHEVALSANGSEALDRLKAGERFDVILCDLLMPEMTGIELFGEIGQRFSSQAERVVFMTGGATSESSRIFIEQQSARVVNKPFLPAEIEAAVLAHAHLPMTTPAPVLLPRS
jgi:signal transduction histidine kinase/ActR/RegA family two-component response regulator